ncbi:MAG TPA: quinone-dependent dihydroorotate dehydrogenase [Bacteroidia bacterium]|nr:quinone-dependent dihydroorotate dehydrogenase [Bacteroidia bacterium]
MYKLFIKPILFLFNPEKAHHITFALLRFFLSFPFAKKITGALFVTKSNKLAKTVAGLHFPNPVGLAAGLDKNALVVDEFACLGFGSIEIGTVTPKAQPGNDKPRLFRLPKDEALINRMGFNNDGVNEAAFRLAKRKNKHIIIGGNIGKNKITPNDNATQDYIISFHALYDVVDYFVVNVSSPNTPNLRELQEKGPLTNLLSNLQKENAGKKIQKPIFLKIAPDLTDTQLQDIVDIVIVTKIAGLIATNTTISREGLITSQQEIQNIGAGGLSGKPLTKRSTEVIKFLRNKLDKHIAIIGVGGIHSAQDAIDKLNAGADLIQLYTGFIYEGPALVKAINKRILSETK